MSIAVTLQETLTVAETLATNVPDVSATNAVVTHNQYNVSVALSATSSPAVSLTASFAQGLTAGAATIDFTALTGTNGATVTGSTKKVIAYIMTNPATNANSITITTGASNGLTIFGASGRHVLQPGQSLMSYDPSGLSTTIDATHKTVDLSGTGAQTLNVIVVMG